MGFSDFSVISRQPFAVCLVPCGMDSLYHAPEPYYQVRFLCSRIEAYNKNMVSLLNTQSGYLSSEAQRLNEIKYD